MQSNPAIVELTPRQFYHNMIALFTVKGHDKTDVHFIVKSVIPCIIKEFSEYSAWSIINTGYVLMKSQ